MHRNRCRIRTHTERRSARTSACRSRRRSSQDAQAFPPEAQVRHRFTMPGPIGRAGSPAPNPIPSALRASSAWRLQRGRAAPLSAELRTSHPGTRPGSLAGTRLFGGAGGSNRVKTWSSQLGSVPSAHDLLSAHWRAGGHRACAQRDRSPCTAAGPRRLLRVRRGSRLDDRARVAAIGFEPEPGRDASTFVQIHVGFPPISRVDHLPIEWRVSSDRRPSPSPRRAADAKRPCRLRSLRRRS